MLNCRQTSQLLSGSLDRSLSLREKLALRIHLLLCDACARFARQLRFLHRLAAELEARSVADERVKLGAGARERIRRALAGEK